MLKLERQAIILNILEREGTIKVSELMKQLDVSDMTIRRDLKELESKNKLRRIHGGAQVKNIDRFQELSHFEKQNINIERKKEVAEMIVSVIQDNDVIFLGAGTTIELVPRMLNHSNLKIVTNSLPVFNELLMRDHYEVVLIGGTYRKITGAFVGGVAQHSVSHQKTMKAFIGVNGIYDNIVTNCNEEEGLTQKVILDNAIEKYIIADSSKLQVLDFYDFYDLNHIDALITDSQVKEEEISLYSQYTRVITPTKK